MNIRSNAIFCIFACLLASCGGQDAFEQKPIEVMFGDAYAKADSRDYEEAARIFAEIETTYPTSEWAASALVNAAYSQYMTNDFAGAITTVDRFLRFHPGHGSAPYAMYLRAMCFFRQVSDVCREPGMSAHALAAFNQLTQRFPNSDYAKNSKNKIVILKNYIAGKMMFSARRDMRKQNYPSAISALQKLIITLPETTMTPEALYRLTEAYRAVGLSDQSEGYALMLRANFPSSDWAAKK